MKIVSPRLHTVLTNALPEASAWLGIDYATVAARNPATSHISILGSGRRPPFGGRRVVDAAAQALSGQALAEGRGREAHGRDDAEVPSRYGLAGPPDALAGSGVMRRAPGGAALDVFPAEPEVPAALLPRPDVILTPHIAFSSAHSVLELRRRSTGDLIR